MGTKPSWTELKQVCGKVCFASGTALNVGNLALQGSLCGSGLLCSVGSLASPCLPRLSNSLSTDITTLELHQGGIFSFLNRN